MKKVMAMLCTLLLLGLTACGTDRESISVGPAEITETITDSEAAQDETEADDALSTNSPGTVTEGTEYYQGFLIDNVFHSTSEGDIHYNVYFPESYDGSEPYALYVTLPGYEGLYFQGVASNLKSEDFGLEAIHYNERMIVLAPQFEDWRETSASQTIALVEYFLTRYNIDADRVYANGYSGGGETMSLVLSEHPDLFTAYLHVSSQWDGTFDAVAEAYLPIYFVVGRDDEYYGSEPTISAYNSLHELYEQQGLTEEEIDELLVLDIKDHAYFTEQGAPNEHGGGTFVAYDEEIMSWLFSKVSDTEETANRFPDYLEEIPEDYLTPASLQGELVDFYYETWESTTYE
ncbi:MAG: prolyl oligopeptidase family serine peptidase [Lachnospiraceae bacterium]|nr:prolyl oligopeptidase family serine peptidase [Lachnospiraceae bacterium]